MNCSARWIPWRPVILLVLFAMGCGRHIQRELIYTDFRSGDHGTALARLPEIDAGGRDVLLNALDRGAIFQAAGDPIASNRALLQADAIFEDLYTKSVTQEIAGLTLSPLVLPYRGENFERVLVHVLSALNFLELGDREGALVECRAINTRLEALAGETETYREDAFARYLAGLVHETSGDPEAAWVDLRRARAIYENDYINHYGTRVPKALENDLLRLAQVLDREDELERLEEETGRKARPLPTNRGEVVVLLGLGMAPEKVEDSIVLLTEDDIPVKVAVPRFHDTRVPWKRVHVSVDGGIRRAKAVLVEDVHAIALQDLEDRIGREYLKAGTRAVAKYLAAEKAREEGGKLAGFVAGAMGAVVETADTRSWRTLPREFRMARILLSPGLHDLSVEIVGRNGEAGNVAIGSVEVRPGSRTFFFHRAPGRP